MDDWTPDPRPVPTWLQHPHEHALYAPKEEWATLAEKLTNPTALLRLAKHVV